MKKILNIVVAILIIASIGVSASAAVTMSPYVFRGTYDDGVHGEREYIFHFGTRDNTEEEVGIEINGEKYKAKTFDTATNTKFGIGIADPSNKLTSTYTVKPYAGDTYGTPVTVDKNAKENVVINVADNGLYNAEPAFTYNGSWMAYKENMEGYDRAATFDQYDDANGTKLKNNVIASACIKTGSDIGYDKPFMQFNINDGLEQLSKGRKVYLYVTVFSNGVSTEDYTLSVYGVEKEGTYSEENIPVRDEINSAIDSVTIKKEWNGASNSQRVSFDVTNYVKKRLYEGATTVSFSFKTSDVTISSNSSENTNIYNSVKGEGYAPALRYAGSYDVETSSKKTLGEFVFSDYSMRHTNGQYRYVTSEYVQQVLHKDNYVYSCPEAYLQWSIPETFTGLDENTRLELVYYAYYHSGDKDVTIRLRGVTNEYDKTARPTTSGNMWSSDYPKKESETIDYIGKAVTVPKTSTKSNPVEIKVDITDYVLSKMANGEDTVTFGFETKYDQAAGTAAGFIYTNITTPNVITGFTPYIQYRQGDKTFLTDGSDVEIPSQITFSNIYREAALWVTTDNKKLASTETVDPDKHVLRLLGGTSSGGNGDTLYNTSYNSNSVNFMTYIVQPYRFVFNISDLTNLMALNEDIISGKRVYLETAIYPRNNVADLTVDGLLGTATNVVFTQPDGTTRTQSAYSADALVDVTSVTSFTSDDLDKIKKLKIDVTDYVVERAKAGDKEVHFVIYPSTNSKAGTSWKAYPRASETDGTSDSCLTIE